MEFLGIYRNLTLIDVIYAALTAFVLTNLIISFRKMRASSLLKKDKLEIKVLQLEEMQKRCEELFPIETIYFRGKSFYRGMNVKITTLQNKIIEGVLVGKNSSNVLCILTTKRIVAQDIDKIESLINID